MCSIAAAGLAIGIVGTAVTAYGQYQAGQSAEKAARAQEQSLLRAAVETEDRGAELAKRRREQTADLRARARVSLAAAGLPVGEHTAAQVEDEISRVGRREEQDIRTNAKRQALGFRESASIAAFEGSQAAQAGSISAAGTALGGLGTVASQWYSYKGKR